jgi:hypothetical protein
MNRLFAARLLVPIYRDELRLLDAVHVPVLNSRTTAKSQTAARMAARSSARSQAAGCNQPTSRAIPAAPAIAKASGR